MEYKTKQEIIGELDELFSDILCKELEVIYEAIKLTMLQKGDRVSHFVPSPHSFIIPSLMDALQGSGFTVKQGVSDKNLLTITGLTDANT